MIRTFRAYLSTWVVRLLFIVLVVAFASWGVGDVLRMAGRGDTTVARVGSIKIEPREAQEAFQRQLAQVTRMLGGKLEPTPEIRRSVAAQALDRLIGQALLEQAARDLHLAVPDAAVVQAVYQVPAFQGTNGQFDRSRFEQLLRTNGLTEPRFLDLVRADLRQRQLLEAVRAGSGPSDTLTRAVFDFQNEKRAADIVSLPFSAAKPPPAPDEEALRRWWENHPDAYRRPEFRRVKVVVLTPETVAKDMTVSDDELRASFDSRKADFATPGKRSAEVVSVADEAKAKAIAASWASGADWAHVQQEAQAAGGAAIELDEATQPEWPTAELGKAVFDAKLDSVSGPVRIRPAGPSSGSPRMCLGRNARSIRSRMNCAAGAGREGRRPHLRPRQQAGHTPRRGHEPRPVANQPRACGGDGHAQRGGQDEVRRTCTDPWPAPSCATPWSPRPSRPIKATHRI